ncbi:diguanylate cyclase (GGDEF) domain-containing protein [Lentzea jiangxiensis]|uniref:Diguanylate cyclase (GGDEF) domain-containing protein n=2 Tax=Lentzea jiangxiensis TaxID=641025 RepID=A0A1H0FG24_9PSEU|nr:diguanylate cyclase (GGDEF) domain-containing protein [Lentzea jiangxiensis]
MATARMGLPVDHGYLRLHDESAPSRCVSCAQPVGAWATDRLTGLLGRWGWDDQAPAAYRRAQRRWEHVALLMVDLDRFKKINDEYGHPAGDVVLTDVAAVLATHTRPTDLVCRHGGDEFLVLLPRTTGREAALIAECILRDIRALQTEITTNDGYHVTLHGQTASIGVSSHVPGSEDTLLDLVRETDAALQRAKRAGRARVQVHDPSAFTTEHSVDPAALHHLLALQDLMSSDQLPQVLVALSDGPKAVEDLVPGLGPRVIMTLERLQGNGFVLRRAARYELTAAAREWITDVLPAVAAWTNRHHGPVR